MFLIPGEEGVASSSLSTWSPGGFSLSSSDCDSLTVHEIACD